MPSVYTTVDSNGVRIIKNDLNELHCLCGPAIIRPDGSKEYWRNDKRHRSGGLPAVIHANGTLEYWENNQLHRIGGPALDQADGEKYWFYRGKQSCLTGPAYTNSNGWSFWYIDGVEYSEKDWADLVKARS